VAKSGSEDSARASETRRVPKSHIPRAKVATARSGQSAKNRCQEPFLFITVESGVEQSFADRDWADSPITPQENGSRRGAVSAINQLVFWILHSCHGIGAGGHPGPRMRAIDRLVGVSGGLDGLQKLFNPRLLYADMRRSMPRRRYQCESASAQKKRPKPRGMRLGPRGTM
jgi:hypothetical protein